MKSQISVFFWTALPALVLGAQVNFTKGCGNDDTYISNIQLSQNLNSPSTFTTPENTIAIGVIDAPGSEYAVVPQGVDGDLNAGIPLRDEQCFVYQNGIVSIVVYVWG
ncbi:hypothetical protein V8E54_009991 [Elaphomyces granulatus]